MVEMSRRATLAAGGSAIAIALAGCLTGGTGDWENEETIPATSATIYMGPSCNCCEVYAEYLDDALTTELETVVTEEYRGVKDDHGIDDALRSCHTVEAGDYVIEGHIPAEIVATLFEDGPDIAGIALPGMPAGSPGMGGEKDEIWTVYEIGPDDEPGVYTEF